MCGLHSRQRKARFRHVFDFDNPMGGIVAGMRQIECSFSRRRSINRKRRYPTIIADALVYDETAERAYQVGESIPYSGNVVWFHENGILQQETRYEDGREHGPTIWWHEDGSRAGQSVHINEF